MSKTHKHHFFFKFYSLSRYFANLAVDVVFPEPCKPTKSNGYWWRTAFKFNSSELLQSQEFLPIRHKQFLLTFVLEKLILLISWPIALGLTI